jgi:hypothetical protein
MAEVTLSKGATVSVEETADGAVRIAIEGAGIAYERTVHERHLNGVQANAEQASSSPRSGRPFALFDGEGVGEPTLALTKADAERVFYLIFAFPRSGVPAGAPVVQVNEDVEGADVESGKDEGSVEG